MTLNSFLEFAVHAWVPIGLIIAAVLVILDRRRTRARYGRPDAWEWPYLISFLVVCSFMWPFMLIVVYCCWTSESK